ncbi:O-methyltransferase [Sporobolomyces salmoneus]|uniref:O-methyltransferase n=1 Tax=Sporobolomyces salmoneus TaxID=183962 RepID=UPI00317C37BC
MPTFVTANTGGTPATRITSLLASSLSTIESTSPAYAALEEAHKISAGQEKYLEEMTGDLIVPKSHQVAKEEVEKVWIELLRKTETTDWKELKAQGKTQWELSVGMCSGAYEAVVLQQLALLLRPKSVLEIGVFTGTATLALALLPSVKHITALDIEEYLPSFVQPFWTRAGVPSKIDFRISPALESLDKLIAEGHEGFDLVFIDADKPGYRAYVERILEGGLLREGGVVLADNTLYKGYPWSPPSDSTTYSTATGTNNQSKREAAAGIDSFNRFVRNHEDLEVVVLPIRDGISIIRRKI